MAQNINLPFSTSDWVKIYQTIDEWEARLIEATLGNQQIRCRPEYSRDADRQRHISLFVAPVDQIEALETVSRISLAVANEESVKQNEGNLNHGERDHNFGSEGELPKATPTAVEKITIAEREEIGKIVHCTGQGYELQVGIEPYYMVEESRWEEFTDFSAQRQEFSILLRHEYPNLFQWLKQDKLMAEFIRLIESTYREVPPPRNQQRSTSSPKSDPSSTHTSDAKISGIAKFSLWISLVSLTAVILQLPWHASLTLSLLAGVTGFVAKYQIDISDGALKGSLIAFLAIIIACIVLAITWKQYQSSQPKSSDLRSAHLLFPTPTGVNTDVESDLTLNIHSRGGMWLLASSSSLKIRFLVKSKRA